VHGDLAPVFLDDLSHDRKAESASASLRLRREEGVEDTGQDIGAHTDARIRAFDDDPLISFGERAKDQAASFGHRIQAVGDHIEEHLLKLLGRAEDFREVGSQLETHFDPAFLERRHDDLHDVLQQGLEAKRQIFRSGPPCGIQEAAHDALDAFDLPEDDGESAYSLFVLCASAQQLNMPGDEIQRRSDLMRELCGQLTGCRQTLHVQELPLNREELKVRLLKLPIPLAQLHGRFAHEHLQTILLGFQSFGHLSNAREERVQPHAQGPDLVLGGHRHANLKIARFGTTHRAEDRADWTVDRSAEEEIQGDGDPADSGQKGEPCETIQVLEQRLAVGHLSAEDDKADGLPAAFNRGSGGEAIAPLSRHFEARGGFPLFGLAQEVERDGHRREILRGAHGQGDDLAHARARQAIDVDLDDLAVSPLIIEGIRAQHGQIRHLLGGKVLRQLRRQEFRASPILFQNERPHRREINHQQRAEDQKDERRDRERDLHVKTDVAEALPPGLAHTGFDFSKGAPVVYN